MKYVFLFLVVYLIGGIPFAYIVGRLILHRDIREVGSKNPGAGNVFLLAGWKAGIVALLGDIGKGFFAMMLVSLAGVQYPSLLFFTFAAILGHVFTPFLLFRGGKGVAVAAGSYAYVIYNIFGLASVLETIIFITLPGILLFKISNSLVISLSVTPVFFLIALRLFAYDTKLFLFSLLMSALIEVLAFRRIKSEWSKFLRNKKVRIFLRGGS